MICDRCKNEMKEGYIPTYGVEWLPKYAKQKLIYNRNKEEGFAVGRRRQLVFKQQPAWYCSECDIIVIDCKDTREEL